MWTRFFDIIRAVVFFSNIYIFLYVVLNTFITGGNLFLMIIVYTIIGYLLYQKIEKEWRLMFLWFDYYWILLPSIFSLFFMINYYFSDSPKIEKYNFRFHIMTDNSPYTKKGYPSQIILENNTYNNYPLIRTFLNYDHKFKRDIVILTTENGFFGLKVLKNYEFSRENLTFE